MRALTKDCCDEVSIRLSKNEVQGYNWTFGDVLNMIYFNRARGAKH